MKNGEFIGEIFHPQMIQITRIIISFSNKYVGEAPLKICVIRVICG